MIGAFGMYGREKWCMQGLVEKPMGKRLLGRQRCNERLILN
jgi:hypothetical protein